MRLAAMKQVRRELGLTQADVARLVGKHQQAVSQIENGLEVTREQAEAFARVLEVDVSDLAGSHVVIPLESFVIR